MHNIEKLCKAKKFGCQFGVHHSMKASLGLILNHQSLRVRGFTFLKYYFALQQKDMNPRARALKFNVSMPFTVK